MVGGSEASQSRGRNDAFHANGTRQLMPTKYAEPNAESAEALARRKELMTRVIFGKTVYSFDRLFQRESKTKVTHPSSQKKLEPV